jgi:hypothetical protein
VRFAASPLYLLKQTSEHACPTFCSVRCTHLGSPIANPSTELIAGCGEVAALELEEDEVARQLKFLILVIINANEALHGNPPKN